MTDAERRRHARIAAPDVHGHLKLDEEVVALGLSVEDISLGGLFLRCEAILPVGTPILVELSQQGADRSLLVRGRVVSALSARPTADGGVRVGMGVRFEVLPEETRQRLHRLVERLTGRAAPRKAPRAGVEEGAEGASPAALSPATQLARSASFDFRPTQLGEDTGEPGWEPVRPPLLQAQVSLAHSRGAGGVRDAARLAVQLQGLLLDAEVGHQQELARRERELGQLRTEVERLRAELLRREGQVRELEARLLTPGA